MRTMLGKPGSIRRWLLGSLIFLSVCLLLFVLSGYLGRILIFLIAIVAVWLGYMARWVVVGDEDEFRAWLKRESKARAQAAKLPEDEPLISDEEWERVKEVLRLQENPHGGAPPAPILESDGPPRNRGNA